VQIEKALSSPVNNFQLSDIAKPGATAGILIDPIVPTAAWNAAVEAVRAKLRGLGIEKLKLFFRTRTSSVETSGPSDDSTSRVVDPRVAGFSEIGKTSSGTRVELEAELLSCNVRLAISLIAPHFASGFTGGADILLPGASSLKTITENRSLTIRSPASQGGTAGNPVFSDALETYKMVAPFYAITFIPDGWGGIASVESGELDAVYQETVPKYLELHSPRIDRKTDVVIVAAGKLMGMDLYHAVRVLSNAFGAVRKDGTIILVAECSKGIGDQTFLEFSRRFSEKRELVAELRHRFKLGSHVSLFLQDAIEKHRIQLVSVLPDLYAKDSFKLKPSRTASAAVQQSIRIEGKEA